MTLANPCTGAEKVRRVGRNSDVSCELVTEVTFWSVTCCDNEECLGTKGRLTSGLGGKSSLASPSFTGYAFNTSVGIPICFHLPTRVRQAPETRVKPFGPTLAGRAFDDRGVIPATGNRK